MKKISEDEKSKVPDDEVSDKSTDTVEIIEADSGDSDIGIDSDGEDSKIVHFVQVDESIPKFVSQIDILRILSSKETFSHILVLLGVLVVFAFLSFTKSDISEKLIISLGYGFSFGYFLTANLSRFKSLNEMLRKVDSSSVFLPAIISGIFSTLIWFGIHKESYGADLHFFLSFGLLVIFVIWQFAQAWWMRIPFKEFSLRKMDKYQDEGETKLGIISNLASPIVWALFGFLIFNFISNKVTKFSQNFDDLFIFSWFLMMLIFGGITFFLLKQMHREFWYNPKVASFSAYFSIGYWGFLSYHAGVLLYSMHNDPSFTYDLVFMIITIFLVIYSLSFQALRTEARRAHLKSTNHYMGKAGNFITKDNVIFYAISFTLAYGASNFFLANSDTSAIGGIRSVSQISHMIVLVSGILVILIVNYNLLTGRGLIQEGFVESMRNPKDN